jgi:hypothetical protein
MGVQEMSILRLLLQFSLSWFNTRKSNTYKLYIKVCLLASGNPCILKPSIHSFRVFSL